jgi:predicted membrane protein
MDSKESTKILTGGMILISLGVLIILSKMGVWRFGQSWPLLLIVIALGTLMQRVKDFGGWIIGSVGIVFLLSENLDVRFYAITTFLLPVLLILVGINTIMKYFKKGGNGSKKGS